MEKNINTWHIKPFVTWWKTEQERFRSDHFNEREIAYAAWLAGINYSKEHNEKETNKD